MKKKLDRFEKDAYRHGFQRAMKDFSCCTVEAITDYLKVLWTTEYHTEFYNQGYEDGIHSWMGDVSFFAHEDLAYEMRDLYEGYWGQGDFEHPSI